MENKIELIGRKSSLLQKFLDATTAISECLGMENDAERVAGIQKNVFERDAIIKELTDVNKLLEAPEGKDEKFDAEYEKHAWLWLNILKEIKSLEDGNSEKIESLMSGYMDKVKSTKDAIKVIDAYASKMGEEGSINIDKNQ